jgi:drug/metabolite transporter (DMT)-like permease
MGYHIVMTIHERTRRLRGIALMILGASVFAGVDAVSKLLAETQSVGQIVWARYALAIPVLLLTTRPSDWRSLFATARPGLQILRGATPLAISGSMVMAVRYLPLAEATVILFAAPFLIVALSEPLLGEPVRPASWIGVIVGFAAVLIVARPGFGSLSRYMLFPLAGAVVFALYQLITRRLGLAGERPNTTLAWTLAVGGLVATPIALLTWHPVSARGWLLMVALGTVFGLAQSLLVRAFTYAPANLLAPFSYCQVVAATVLGMIVFDAIPDAWTFAGIALIIAAGVYVMRTRG